MPGGGWGVWEGQSTHTGISYGTKDIRLTLNTASAEGKTFKRCPLSSSTALKGKEHQGWKNLRRTVGKLHAPRSDWGSLEDRSEDVENLGNLI